MTRKDENENRADGPGNEGASLEGVLTYVLASAIEEHFRIGFRYNYSHDGTIGRAQ